jgi:hypothetical protein
MPTRNLIQDIVEASKASVADPSNWTEVAEASAASAIVACYALGEILDDLVARVGHLEQQGREPDDLSAQLEDIKKRLAKVEKKVGKVKRKSKK